MGDKASNTKVANSLVALSSAAVVAVYGAGYARTRAAADRVTPRAAERRPHIPLRSASATPIAGKAPAAANASVVATPPAAAPQPAAPTPAPAANPAPAQRSRPSPKPAATAHAATITARVEEIAAPASDAPPAPAAASTTPPAPAPAPDAVAATSPAAASSSKYRDGTYLGWGTSPHGDIQASVVVQDGRITAARVAQCLTRYSCSWIAAIPPVILQQQGPTYDYVSGATESSDAFQTAVADALSHAL